MDCSRTLKAMAWLSFVGSLLCVSGKTLALRLTTHCEFIYCVSNLQIKETMNVTLKLVFILFVCNRNS